jgi:hypothetical protein
MTRTLKIIVLALTTALAVPTLGAATASAEMTFTGYEGAGTHVSTIFTGLANPFGIYELRSTPKSWVMDCSAASLGGSSATGESKTLTMSSTGATCLFGPGKYKSDLNMNSCDYKYNLTKKINEHKYEGTTDIQCTKKGDVIDIKATETGTTVLCTLTIEEQSGVGPIYFENETPNPGLKYVLIKHRATNLKTITEAPSGKPEDCGVTALGTHATGELNTEIFLYGTNKEEEQINVTVSG